MIPKRARLGRLYEVENRERKFGAVLDYILVWVSKEDPQSRPATWTPRPLMLTENELKEAAARADKNWEDVIPLDDRCLDERKEEEKKKGPRELPEIPGLDKVFELLRGWTMASYLMVIGGGAGLFLFGWSFGCLLSAYPDFPGFCKPECADCNGENGNGPVPPPDPTKVASLVLRPERTPDLEAGTVSIDLRVTNTSEQEVRLLKQTDSNSPVPVTQSPLAPGGEASVPIDEIRAAVSIQEGVTRSGGLTVRNAGNVPVKLSPSSGLGVQDPCTLERILDGGLGCSFVNGGTPHDSTLSVTTATSPGPRGTDVFVTVTSDCTPGGDCGRVALDLEGECSGRCEPSPGNPCDCTFEVACDVPRPAPRARVAVNITEQTLPDNDVKYTLQVHNMDSETALEPLSVSGPNDCTSISTRLDPRGVFDCSFGTRGSPPGGDWCTRARVTALQALHLQREDQTAEAVCLADEYYGYYSKAAACSAPEVHEGLRRTLGLLRGKEAGVQPEKQCKAEGTALDVSRCAETATKSMESEGPIHAVTFNKEGRLVVGSGDTSVHVHLVDPENPARSKELLHLEGRSDVSVAQADDLVAVGTGKGEVFVVDVTTCRPTCETEQTLLPGTGEGTGRIGSVALFRSGTGRVLLAAGGSRTVKLWARGDGGRWADPVAWTGGAEVFSVAFSPAGDSMAAATSGGVMLLNVAPQPALRRSLPGRETRSVAYGVSAEGAVFLAGGGANGETAVWRLDGTGNPPGAPTILAGHRSAVNALSFSSGTGSLQVASASSDGTVKVWASVNGSWSDEPVVLPDHKSYVWSVAFRPDSDELVSASEDRTVRRWTTDTQCLYDEIRARAQCRQSPDETRGR